MRVASAHSKAGLSEHVCLCLKRSKAAYSVHSPPQPNPGLPGFGCFKICRKRASPQPAGEGLGVGVARLTHRRLPCAPPPSPTLPHKGGGSRLSSPLMLIPFHTTRSSRYFAGMRRVGVGSAGDSV